MAWIIFDSKLEHHPKTKHLMALMGWDLDTTLGKLARFWFWCQTYAEDGQLAKFSDVEIAGGAGVGLDRAAEFVKTMKTARWIDRKPCRVHDWWDHQGAFLRKRYNKRPEAWKRIEALYKREEKGSTPGVLPEGNQDGSGRTQRREEKRREDHPLTPPVEIEEPTDPDDRLKFLLERKVARLTALPWGTPAQEESARDTLTQLAVDLGEEPAVERLVAAYRWRPEGQTYRTPASMPDLLFRLAKSEEAAPAQRPTHELPPTVEVPDDFPG